MAFRQLSGAPYSVSDAYRYNGEVAPDIAVEEQALNRKQQIANLLLQQGMQGAGAGQMVGRFYVPNSPMQHVSKLAEIMAGALGTRAIDTQRVALSDRMNQERGRAINDYVEKTKGLDIPAHTLPEGSPGVPPSSNLRDVFADKPAMPGPPQMRNAPNELSGFGASFQPAPPLRPSYGEDRANPGDYRENLLPSAALADGIRRRMQPPSASYQLDPGTPAVPPTEGPVNAAQFMPPNPIAARQSVMEAMSHQDPRVREAVKFMEQQQAQDEEKNAARAFLASQGEENRAVRREGIESNALTRVEQMKNTMTLTQMQIDGRTQAGQNANDLKEKLADQNTALQKELHRIDNASRERVGAGHDDAKGAKVSAKGTVAEQAVDRAFAKEYVEFNAAGGYADVQKSLTQLQTVADALDKKELTGPMTGRTPDFIRGFTNPDSIAMRDTVEEVVQRNLRLILGGQFAQLEAAQLIKRAYNENLSETENKVRVDRLMKQMKEAAQAKADASAYFQEHGTLTGWKGRLWRMTDFTPEKETGGAPSHAGGTPAQPATGVIPIDELLKKYQ